MNKLFLLVFSLLSLSAIAQTKEEKLWQQIDVFHKAVFETKDSVTISKMVGEKLTYGHSAGNLENKAEMVHNAVASRITYKNLTTEKLSLNFLKNTAIVRLNFRGTSVDRGTESPLNLSMLQVWAKEGGAWKLQARQAVRINPR